MTVKDRLHNAVETMSDEEASAALRTLAEASGDPVGWMLDHAPVDDEPETEEERRAVAEARADRERGIEPVPLESVLAEFDVDR
jgi:hypothetical protein